MEPEAAESVAIADKHLPGASAECRLALAKDINAAIIRHATRIAEDALSTAVAVASAASRKH